MQKVVIGVNGSLDCVPSSGPDGIAGGAYRSYPIRVRGQFTNPILSARIVNNLTVEDGIPFLLGEGECAEAFL